MSKTSLPLITEVDSLNDFNYILANNPGIVIVKFGATWCGPCKRIEPQVHHFMDHLPPTMQGLILDVDENFEIYGFFQKKRLLKGIPAILAFYVGDSANAPSDCVLGSNTEEINLFFERCYRHIEKN